MILKSKSHPHNYLIFGKGIPLTIRRKWDPLNPTSHMCVLRVLSLKVMKAQKTPTHPPATHTHTHARAQTISPRSVMDRPIATGAWLAREQVHGGHFGPPAAQGAVRLRKAERGSNQPPGWMMPLISPRITKGSNEKTSPFGTNPPETTKVWFSKLVVS